MAQTDGIRRDSSGTHKLGRSDLALLESAEAELWLGKLRLTERPCGCKSGAALSSLAVLAWPAWKVVSGLPRSPLAIATGLAVYMGVVVGSGIVGKVAGIAVGRRRHHHVRRDLDRRINAVAAVQVG